MPRFTQSTATIAAGEAFSDVIDCSTGAPVMIFVPDGWTPARMSFQMSPDGTTFFDLFDRNAQEIAFNVVDSTTIVLGNDWKSVTYLRIRSGSRFLPVAQIEQRKIIVTIDTQPV